MKILKPGIKPEEIVTRDRCSRCGCEFEYTRADVHTDQREGDYVNCPCCNVWISAKVWRGNN